MRTLALLGEDAGGDGRGARLRVRGRGRPWMRNGHESTSTSSASRRLIGRTADEIRRLADPARALPDHGGLRRPHARHLPLRPQGPAAGERRADPRPRLSRSACCPMGRIDDGLALAAGAGNDLRRVRRHDAGARHAGQPAGAQGAGHGRAHRLLAARCAEAGPAQPRPARHVLRDRLRDDGAVDRAHAEAGHGRRESATSRSSAITSPSSPPSARSSTRPTCGSTAFIGPGHVSTVIGCRPYEWIARDRAASRSWCPASSRSTCCSRS